MTTDQASHLKITRTNVALISIAGSLIILFIKWLAYQITGSAALKSDALESVVNVVAASFAFGAVLFAEQPADREHPYGHGKMEFFSSAFEGGLISLASIMILYEAIKSLVAGPRIENLSTGLILNLAAGVLNGVLGFYLIRAGKKLKSEAIEADGKHVFTDFLTTAGILAGLLVVKFTGFLWLDPIIAIVVGGMLGFTGFKLVHKASNALLDTQDPELSEKVIAAVNKFRTDDLIAIHEMRTMKSGRHVHVDMHVVVPEFYEVRKAHDFVESFGNKIMKDADIEGEVHSHVDPCYRSYCSQCAVEPCTVRKEKLQMQRVITVASAEETDELIHKGEI